MVKLNKGVEMKDKKVLLVDIEDKKAKEVLEKFRTKIFTNPKVKAVLNRLRDK